MHCEGDGIDEELVSLGKLMVSEGAALREAGAKFKQHFEVGEVACNTAS